MHARPWLPVLLIVVGTVGCQQYESEPEPVTVPAVIDGDTLEVYLGEKQKTVNLCGIDAPELDEPLGMEAQEVLQSLVYRDGGQVHLVMTGRGEDGAVVAEAWFLSMPGEEEIHINSEMLVQGMAVADPSNCHALPQCPHLWPC